MRLGATPSPVMETPQLLTTGLYVYSRNPMYVAGIVYFIGLAIYLQSAAAMAYACAIAFIYYPLLIKSEEKSMRKRFGSAYDAYCAQTPRWISLRRDPRAKSSP